MAEDAVGDLPDALLRVGEDELLLCGQRRVEKEVRKAGFGVGFAGEGIVFRYCHDIAVVADAGIDCVLAEQRKMHERQIQFVVVDEHFQREGSPLCDGKLDVRIAVLERKKHLGQNDGADMGRSPETKDAFALGLYLTQLLVEAAAKRDGLTGKFNVFLACVGRDKSTFGALEKPGLKLRFQPCEENAEGRLGDIELFGGFREAFFLIDGQNIFKISVFHETAPFCQRGCFVAFIIAQNGKNEKRNWPMQSTGQFREEEGARMRFRRQWCR